MRAIKAFWSEWWMFLIPLVMAVGIVGGLWLVLPQTRAVATDASETTLAVIERCVDEARAGHSPIGIRGKLEEPNASALANCLRRTGLLRDGER